MKQELRNSFILVLFLIGSYQVSFSQENISSSRPGQCIGSQTIGRGVLQFQTGIQYDFGVAENLQIPGVLMRYGLLEHMEVRVSESINTQQGDWDITLPEFSLLIDLTKGSVVIPEMAISVYSNAGLMKQTLTSGVILSGANSILDQIGYSFIVGGSYSTDFLGNYAFALNYSLNKVTPFVEVYGVMQKNGMKFDTGFAYLLTKDIQLDVYVGSDIMFEQYFISTGVSFRF